MPLSREAKKALIDSILEQKRLEDEEKARTPTALDNVATLGMRLVPAVAGGMLGAAGGPVGIAAGGGAGAALGETAAQAYEKWRGKREAISPTGIAIEAALGAVPLGRGAMTLGRAAKQGALMAGGGYAAHKVLEEGEMPGIETLPIAGLGAVLGGGAHAALGAAGRMIPRRAPVPPAPVPEEVGPFARVLGMGPREPLQIAEHSVVPRPAGPSRMGRRPPVATDLVGSPMEGLTGLGREDAAAQVARQTEREAAMAPGSALIPRRPVGRPIDLVPAPAEGLPPIGQQVIGPERQLAEQLPIPGQKPPIIPRPPVATDVVRSPQPGLTGLGAAENDAINAARTAERLAETRAAQAAPRVENWQGVEPQVPPAAKVAPEAAGAPTESEIPAPLLEFLRGKTSGVTLAMLRKKFGAAIEPVIEKLARAGKLQWGGKPGSERFSLGRNAGFAGNELQQMLGGAAVGGAVGASQGETPGERITYGLAGAGAGAAGGAQLARFLERRRLGPNPSKVAEAILGPASATGAGGPTIPAAARVATDKKIPVIGGQTLTSAQGTVPIVESAVPQGKLPRTGPTPNPRYKTAGLNFEKYDSVAQRFLKEMVADPAVQAAADQQGRGRLPIAWIRERANARVSQLAKTLKPGTALNAEDIMAQELHLGAMSSRTSELAQTALRTGTLEDKLKWAESYQQTRILFLNATGAQSEAGRALRVLRELREGMSVSQRLVSEAMKQGRLTKVMGEFDNIMAQIPSDPTEAAKFLSANMDHGAFDKLTSYFMANILSAIPSYIRNGIGSAVNSVGRVAVKGMLAGPMDALISKLTGRQRAIYSTEALHEIAGSSFALRQGLDDAWSTLRNGFSTKAIQEGVEFGELNLPKVEFTGGLLNPWNQPGRILEATDRFFQTFNQATSKNGLIWARAQREADAKGLVGQAFDDFMTQRMSQLQADDFIRGASVQEGRVSAFREDPGKIANTLIGLKQQAPILNYIIPFVKTVSNIFRQGIEHSPLAPVLSRTRQQMFPNKAGMSEAEAWMADRKQSEAFAKWAFGLASMVPIGVYAATGKLSGSGPSDPAKRAALYEQGWRPNSIQIGDKWYTYSTWQPLSIPMALVANAFESYEDSVDAFSKEGKEVDWEKAAAATAFKVLNSATQQSYLQGVMALSAAMEDPDQFAENFLRQMAQGFYPMSGLQRTIARAVDPNIRENKTVQESLQRITPGISQDLPSRLNRWGEDVTYSGGPVWRAIGGPVLGGEGRKQDPINDELMRLKIDVGLPSERVVMGGKQVPLERAQGHELRQIKGKLVRSELERVILAPGYAELPDPIKRERIEDTLARTMRSNSKRVRMGLQSNPNDFLSLLRERAANRGN